PLEAGEVLADLRLDGLQPSAPAGQVQFTHLGGEDESGRHREADARHLHQARSFAAQELPHVPMALGPASPEKIDVCPLRPVSPAAAGWPSRTISEKSATRRN